MHEFYAFRKGEFLLHDLAKRASERAPVALACFLCSERLHDVELQSTSKANHKVSAFQLTHARKTKKQKLYGGICSQFTHKFTEWVGY